MLQASDLVSLSSSLCRNSSTVDLEHDMDLRDLLARHSVVQSSPASFFSPCTLAANWMKFLSLFV